MMMLMEMFSSKIKTFLSLNDQKVKIFTNKLSKCHFMIFKCPNFDFVSLSLNF